MLILVLTTLTIIHFSFIRGRKDTSSNSNLSASLFMRYFIHACVCEYMRLEKREEVFSIYLFRMCHIVQLYIKYKMYLSFWYANIQKIWDSIPPLPGSNILQLNLCFQCYTRLTCIYMYKHI